MPAVPNNADFCNVFILRQVGFYTNLIDIFFKLQIGRSHVFLRHFLQSDSLMFMFRVVVDLFYLHYCYIVVGRYGHINYLHSVVLRKTISSVFNNTICLIIIAPDYLLFAFSFHYSFGHIVTIFFARETLQVKANFVMSFLLSLCQHFTDTN